MLKLGRYALTKFINLITGHNELAYHAGLCNNNDTYNGCSFFNLEVETFFHFVTDCPALRILRAKNRKPNCMGNQPSTSRLTRSGLLETK